MYIDLFGSSDYLGGNIGDITAQLLHSIHDKMYIKYTRDRLRVYHPYNQSYNSTIFMQTLFDIIDEHNKTIEVNDDTFKTYIDLASPGHFEIFSKALLKIQCDFFSCFKKNLYKQDFKENFLYRAKVRGYDVPFDPKKTILVHLRLFDVKNRPDYDGRVCTDFFKNHIESGLFADEETNRQLKIHHPNTNCQAPLNFDKIQTVINKIKQYKPDHEVILITNPGENLSHLPYRVISHTDESHDLFLLCSCETVILSRSQFALMSLLFGIANDIHIPLWGHLPCYGLYTKYDKNSFNYFY
jgi:hypothetical protein